MRKDNDDEEDFRWNEVWRAIRIIAVLCEWVCRMLNEFKVIWCAFNKNEFRTPFKLHINEYDYHTRYTHFVYFVARLRFFASIWIHWKKEANRTRLKITNANRPIKCGLTFDLKWQFACKYPTNGMVPDPSITFDWQYSAILISFLVLFLRRFVLLFWFVFKF